MRVGGQCRFEDVDEQGDPVFVDFPVSGQLNLTPPCEVYGTVNFGGDLRAVRGFAWSSGLPRPMAMYLHSITPDEPGGLMFTRPVAID